MLEAISDALLVLDADWRITYINAEAARLNRKPAEAFLGRTVWEEWPAAAGSEVERQYRRAVTEKVPVHFEHRYVAPGWDIWLDLCAFPFRSGLVVHYRDITGRKVAEDQVRRTVEEFEALFESIPVGVSIATEDCRVMRVNAVLAEVLGVSTAENSSKSGPEADRLPYRILSGGRELRPEELPQQTAHRERRATPETELEVVRNDGVRRYLYGSAVPLFDGAGKVRGSVAAYVDVTESRAIEEELRHSEERYRSLVSATAAFVWTSDANGEFSWAQPAWEAYTGQTWDEYKGGGWIYAVHPDDRGRIVEAWQAAVASRSLYQVEWRAWNAATGEWRHCSTRGVPVLGRDGEAREWIGAVTDIHEQKMLEAKLQHEAKMESLTVLAGGVAHDFNNLLVAIIGNASLAMDAAGPQIAPLLEHILQAGERAAHLTRQMLAYAGKGQFFYEAVDLSSEARAVAELLQSAFRPCTRLELKLEDGLPAVHADRGQIQQILMNLLINASEAFFEGEGVIRVSTAEERGEVVLRVADDGVGMTAAVRERIFDPFFSTKFAGRGLGLAAVRGIVHAHNGRIEVDSAPGRGTTFRVALPGIAARAAEAAAAVSAPAWVNATVLVIDDEAVVLALARRALAGAGIRGFYADSGRAGIRMYREHADEIDTVVLDVLMPDLGGYDVLKALREIRPDVRVVLSSGNPKAEICRYFGEDAPSGFLPKPYKASTLVAAVAANAEDAAAREGSSRKRLGVRE